MGDELTDYKLTQLSDLIEKIQHYIESNECRMKDIEVCFAKLQTTTKNFMWFFGVFMTVVTIATNIIVKFL